jgi:hypothetical protein
VKGEKREVLKSEGIADIVYCFEDRLCIVDIVSEPDIVRSGQGVTMVSLTAEIRELCPIVRDATFPRVGRKEAEALLRPVNR